MWLSPRKSNRIRSTGLTADSLLHVRTRYFTRVASCVGHTTTPLRSNTHEADSLRRSFLSIWSGISRRVRRSYFAKSRRTRWPWVIAHPGLPQTRTCGHYRIRFLSSWIRCMTKLGSHRACGSKRVTAEQSTEFLPSASSGCCCGD